MFGKPKYYTGDSSGNRTVLGRANSNEHKTVLERANYISSARSVGRPIGVTIIGALQIFGGILMILIGIFAILIMDSLVNSSQSSLTSEATATQIVFMAFIIAFLVILSIFQIVLGYFLLKGKNWARYAVAILSIPGFLFLPIGTLFSAATIYFLFMEKKGKAFFEQQQY